MTWILAGLRFAGRNWKAVLIAVLVGALLAQSATLRRTRFERDGLAVWRDDIRSTTSRAAGITHNGRPATLRADQVAVQIVYLGTAIERLKAALATKNAETDRRGELLAAARAEDMRTRAEADRRYSAAEASIARLRALAARPGDPRCSADPALLRELDDL